MKARTSWTTLLAAVILCGTSLATTGTKAENYYGPAHNGSQCFASSPGWGRDGFGYWGSCPASSSAAAPAATIRRTNTARAQVRRSGAVQASSNSKVPGAQHTRN
jgi:hypothetical protein